MPSRSLGKKKMFGELGVKFVTLFEKITTISLSLLQSEKQKGS